MVQLASVDPSRDGDTPADEPFDVEPPYQPDQASLAAVPLLVGGWFTAIFVNHLDDLFMVRVAGLKRRIAADLAVRAASGLMPREVLEQIWAGTRELMERHARLFR